jgi:hypothetical protein
MVGKTGIGKRARAPDPEASALFMTLLDQDDSIPVATTASRDEAVRHVHVRSMVADTIVATLSLEVGDVIQILNGRETATR